MDKYIVYKLKLNKRKIGLIKTTDPNFKKIGEHKQFYTKVKKLPGWHEKPIKGTKKELERAFKVAEEYLYKLLNYAEKDEAIPKEELEEAKRIFAFARQGPKATYHILNKRCKLVSADILYILTTTLPSKEITRIFGMEQKEVLRLRRGENPTWRWEYNFVKRIRGAIKGNMIQIAHRSRIYSLSKVHSPTNKEVLVYTTAYRKAVKFRESFISQKEMKKLVKEEILDILYPIERIELV